jgi:DNA topoisomerase-1
MGRFGPFIQIGTKDDEEKPRFLPGYVPGKMDHINLADAMELFIRRAPSARPGQRDHRGQRRALRPLRSTAAYASLKEDDPIP